MLDVDHCIATLQGGECVSEHELRQLCQLVGELLMEESNVQPVLSPVTIVGDLHGQFFDLLNLLKVGGWPPETAYVFLGDFVDRGHNSVETLSLLLCLKLKYPGHVTLLRGNHEVSEVKQYNIITMFVAFCLLCLSVCFVKKWLLRYLSNSSS
jgi:serine/threonine-protein phosphatase 6 catalytic subunit